MARTIPDSTKISLHQRLLDRRRERWPELVDVQLRFRGRFAYIEGELEGGEILPLCRLRYNDSASRWGFAIYRASRDGYQEGLGPAERAAHRHPPGSPGLRLRPVLERPQRLAERHTTTRPVTPHELTGRTTISVVC